MSGQHHFVLRPEKSLFVRLLSEAEDHLDRLAGKLDVSTGTASKLVHGTPVTPRILQQIASKLGLSPSQLIENDVETMIPTDLRIIRKLKWGWFIDNDRFRGGAPKWFWEKIEWGAQANSGRIKNLHGTEYRFVCQRIGDRLFLLTAKETKGQFSFASSFTHYFPIRKIMTGIWSGVNDMGIPTVYRMFLSESELSASELQEISLIAKVDTIFSANTLQLEGEKQSAKVHESSKKT